MIGFNLAGASPAEMRANLSQAVEITSPIKDAIDVTRTPVAEVIEPTGNVWLHADVTANVTGVGSGTDIVLNQTHSSSNSVVSLDSTTGHITIKAGHLFSFKAYVKATAFSDTTNGFARYEWVVEPGNVEILGSSDATIFANSRAVNESQMPVASCIVRVVADTVIKLRCADAVGTHTLQDFGTSVEITELSTRYLASDIETVNASWKVAGTEVATGTARRSYNTFKNSAFDGMAAAAAFTRTNLTAAADPDRVYSSRLTVTTPTSAASLEQAITVTNGGANSVELWCRPTGSGSITYTIAMGTDSITIPVTITNGTATLGTVVTTAGITHDAVTVINNAWGSRGVVIPNIVASGTSLTAKLDIPANSTLTALNFSGWYHMHSSTGLVSYYDTGNVAVTTLTMPRLVWGEDEAGIPNLGSVQVDVTGKNAGAVSTTPVRSVSYRSKLDSQLVFTATGQNILLIGESAGATPVDIHMNGNLANFPSAAGEQGGMAFQRVDTGADVNYAVTLVSGTAPNRIATVVLDTPVTNVRMRNGSTGANMTAATLSALLTNVTGGTETLDGFDRVHRYTASDLFDTDQSMTVTYLLVAGGGGGGGWRTSGGGAGGGAGGVLYSDSLNLDAGTMVVTIGAGGAGGASSAGGGSGAGDATTDGTNGQNSVFGALTAIGGGGAGGRDRAGKSGGSGGGAGVSSTQFTAAAGTADQGFAGGINFVSANYGAGGGGGAMGNGGAGTGSRGGHGGAGLDTTITGTSVGLAGGGAADMHGSSAPGTATHGGGAVGAAGSANTGGGGGGALQTGGAGGAGGSGLLVVRYPLHLAARAARFVSAS